MILHIDNSLQSADNKGEGFQPFPFPTLADYLCQSMSILVIVVTICIAPIGFLDIAFFRCLSIDCNQFRVFDWRAVSRRSAFLFAA